MGQQLTIREYIHGFTSHPCTFGVDESQSKTASRRTRPVPNQIKPHCREFMGPRAQYGDEHRPQIDEWLDLPIVDLDAAPPVLQIREGGSLLYGQKRIRTRIEMRIQKSQKGGNDNQESGQFMAITPDFSFVACEPGSQKVTMTTEIKPSINNDVMTTFKPELPKCRALSEAVIKQLYQYIDYDKYQLGYWSFGTEKLLLYGRFRKPVQRGSWPKRKNASTDREREHINGLMEFHAVAW
ncbi:MAG: hypothetical protein Q9170_005236 [Blastenia crenularia]